MCKTRAKPALESPGKIGNLDCPPKNSAGSKGSQLKKEMCRLLPKKLVVVVGAGGCCKSSELISQYHVSSC